MLITLMCMGLFNAVSICAINMTLLKGVKWQNGFHVEEMENVQSQIFLYM